MSRRLIMIPKQIQLARVNAWSKHYENRRMVKAMISAGWNALSIIQNLQMDFPEPIMGMDGELLPIPLEIRRKHGDALPFNLSHLLCVWYWSDSGWTQLERAFQSLPEPIEDYYWRYDPEPNDRLILVPVSNKPKQGQVGAPQKVHVPYFSLSRGG